MLNELQLEVTRDIIGVTDQWLECLQVEMSAASHIGNEGRLLPGGLAPFLWLVPFSQSQTIISKQICGSPVTRDLPIFFFSRKDRNLYFHGEKHALWNIGNQFKKCENYTSHSKCTWRLDGILPVWRGIMILKLKQVSQSPTELCHSTDGYTHPPQAPFLIQLFWDRGQKSAFLTNSPEMLMGLGLKGSGHTLRFTVPTMDLLAAWVERACSLLQGWLWMKSCVTSVRLVFKIGASGTNSWTLSFPDYIFLRRSGPLVSYCLKSQTRKCSPKEAGAP